MKVNHRTVVTNNSQLRISSLLCLCIQNQKSKSLFRRRTTFEKTIILQYNSPDVLLSFASSSTCVCCASVSSLKLRSLLCSKMRLPLLVFLHLIAAAAAADIPLGSTLYASDPNSRWTSSNRTYAVSFVTASDGTLVAAVSYNNITIWQVGAAAKLAPSAVLRLLPSGDLQLLPNSTAATPLWSSGTTNIGVSAASVEESGNFVLKNSSGAALWSTFGHPTDAIVPTQRLTVNHTLVSGNYSFKIQPNGNLTLFWNNTVVYYNSGLNSTANFNLTNPILDIQPLGIITLSDPTLTSPLDLAYSSDYADEGDILRFLKLDSDGNLRIYSSARGSGRVDVRWAAVTDQCQVFGFCGNMGVCSYNDSYPVCGCPSLNFEPIDPNDTRKGCKRKVEISDCPGNASMLQLDHTMFLTYPPELSTEVYFMGISPCRLNCLVGSNCVSSTALADGSGLCYLKTSAFVGGYHSPAIPSTSFVKVCSPLLPNPSLDSAVSRTTKWRLTAWLVAVVVVATLAGLLFVEGGLWWWCLRNSAKFGRLSSQYALLEYASGAPVQFSYKELHKATKGFKEKLGAGGFGAVYKGVLANKTTAAVKQLEGIEQGEKQFRMEVATISTTHHLNLVRLIGFCSEGRHRLLVYEFITKSSLDSFLFDPAPQSQSGKQLGWEYRYGIALGTARGITYLHEECRDCIVHCDIKPENILIDENYCAKVSDFGLAKLVNPKDHRYRTLTSVRGTRGYLAPEWLANLPITSKSDVYSYGMVLLEIVSGKRNFEVSEETSNKKFSVWAYDEFEKGNVEAIIDRRLDRSDVNIEQAMRAIQVSFWCIQEQPSLRPMMGKVVQMLEGVIEIDRPPAPKAAGEGSIGGTSMTTSSTSALSTFAASMPMPSSSSSFRIVGGVQSESTASARLRHNVPG
ncbi:G-type lectin S-receptor-like serine/threonine-protein kinase At1g34300 [Andrographis paniculata]|uniref:G-type lectin S-receptor-like serine/threonine-protein kinase At1g34300 n=1 Tax=Andrographis paniculata TaxID=175694 RepID=UPI0021E8E59E|nr:G-type lectin S-receptor-like serine/threonine-protein kinase At1g34300 [Andrographis paniculata]